MDPHLLVLAGGGVVGGLVLLGRGFGGYRDAARIADTSPSRIASTAVGEVLVTGIVVPAELTLISPLQSQSCVFYRSRIVAAGDDKGSTAFREEAAVGFRVRDESGDLRVFPRGALFDVPDRFDERSGALGENPAGLRVRTGSSYGPGDDRAAQVAALLTVHPAGGELHGEELGGRPLSGLWLALVTSASFVVGRHLIEGLKNPTVVRDRSAREAFAIRPMGVGEAIRRSLEAVAVPA